MNRFAAAATAHPPPHDHRHNIGGCLIPVGSVLYEIVQLAASSPQALVAAGSLVNRLVCYLIARPVPNNGIVSIGGAGTFDGIVLSGIIAAFIA